MAGPHFAVGFNDVVGVPSLGCEVVMAISTFSEGRELALPPMNEIRAQRRHR